jgi:hypothetical protein
MTMMTQLEPVRSRAVVPITGLIKRGSIVDHFAGRLIQLTLALYLLPALVVVLAVGGVGILILKASQFLTGPIKRPVD